MTVPVSTILLAGDGWSPLDFDPGTLVWTWIVFAVVVFVIAKVAWNPLIGALEQRESKIRDGLAEAEQAREEARELAAQFESRRREALADARRVSEEARASAERLAADVQADARTQAEQLLERAKDEIAQAQRQALEEIRAEAVDLAITAASTVLKKNIDKASNRRLAEDAIKKVTRS